MSNDCRRFRERIADLVTGFRPEPEGRELQDHLRSCPTCRDYLQTLKQEDASLTEYFAEIDEGMAHRQERALQMIECSDAKAKTDITSIWRKTMRSRLSRTAVAAAIVLAAALGITYLGGRLDGTSVAWARVAQKLDQIHDFVYRQRQINSSAVKTPQVEFKQQWELRCYYSCEFGSRWDQYGEWGLISQFYTLLKSQQFVSIRPQDRTFRSRREPLPQTMPLDPIGEVRQILAEPYVKLGRTTIEGIRVEGIEVQGQKVGIVRLDDAVSRLWVNVETELPVRMEAEGRIHGSDMHALFIRDQFQWNPGLTEADFTPAITSDFKQEDWPAENTATQPESIAASAPHETDVDFGLLQERGLLDNDQTAAQPPLAATGMEEIHAARDEIMRAWPKYADLRDALRQELDEKLNLQSCSVDELVQFAVLLREEYWDVGGDLSPTSYRYGYMARVLLEIAHAREPNDLSVGDELAETIMSLETTAGDDFWPVLRELRGRQFRQACAEVEAGRAPVWEDFARACDLINLLSVNQPEEAVPIVDWLMGHAQTGGWTGYGDLLEWIRTNLAHKGGLGYSIYRHGEYPEEFRYGNRLPSFRGPQKRGAVPDHPLQRQPVQEQNP